MCGEKVSRENYIRSLFNAQDERQNNEVFSALKDEFINQIVIDSLYINKYSNEIIAEAKSSILRNNIEEEASIFLKQEIIDRQFVKWVIIDFKANFYNFEKSDSAYQKFTCFVRFFCYQYLTYR